MLLKLSALTLMLFYWPNILRNNLKKESPLEEQLEWPYNELKGLES
jgi:hypothetical protein